MKKNSRTLYKLAAALLLTVALVAPFSTIQPHAAADKMKPEEVVAKHLDAIGTQAARAAVKSRIIQGTTLATFRIGGTGSAEGGSVLASTGESSLIAIIYQNQEYPFEKMGFNGKTAYSASLKPGS